MARSVVCMNVSLRAERSQRQGVLKASWFSCRAGSSVAFRLVFIVLDPQTMYSIWLNSLSPPPATNRRPAITPHSFPVSRLLLLLLLRFQAKLITSPWLISRQISECVRLKVLSALTGGPADIALWWAGSHPPSPVTCPATPCCNNLRGELNYCSYSVIPFAQNHVSRLEFEK